jgi:hypothetical protein
MKTSWSKTRKGVEFWRIYWAGYLLSLRRGVLVAFDMRFLGRCSITTAAGARSEHNEQYMNIRLDGGIPHVLDGTCIHACSFPHV